MAQFYQFGGINLAVALGLIPEEGTAKLTSVSLATPCPWNDCIRLDQ